MQAQSFSHVDYPDAPAAIPTSQGVQDGPQHSHTAVLEREWRHIWQQCRLLAVFATALLGGCQPPTDTTYLGLANQYDVTIERDAWGVPHVLGVTDADAAFGLAYAQAEDNNRIIEDSLRAYRAQLAAEQGADAAPVDFLVQWLGLQQRIANDFRRTVSPDMQAYLDAFADGLNYYAAKHPQDFDTSLLPVTAEDLMVGYLLRHLLFYGFDETVKELNGPRRPRDISTGPEVSLDGVPIGSNAFAVSPIRSDDGSTRLAINSHQPLTGPVAWYEAHIRSEQGLDVMGGLFPGSPTMGVDFNRSMAWGATVNKPDLVDVYVLEIHPDDPNQYRLDGEWRTLEQFDIAIRVKLWGPFWWTVHREGLRSEHGPVLRTEHGTYAVRYAGMNEMRQPEQWHAMSRANSVAAFRDALALHRFASFNFVAADRDGHIGFFHNAMIPMRVPGYNWRQYLPGDRSDLIWDRYIPWPDLPAVIDPPSGFVLSTNQSPFQISEDGSNPDPGRYRPEDGFQTRMTNRATRGLELFGEYGAISEAEFSAIKHDNQYSPNSRAGRWLQRVLREVDETDPDLGEARRILADWDLATNVANRGAALGTCVIYREWLTEQQGKQAPDPTATLKDCAALIHNATGQLDPRYGDINRHVRGDDFDEPLAGGPDTLRAVYGSGLEETGFNTNIAGDGLYYLVSWDAEGHQQISGVHPFGSATLDDQSAHFSDQAADFVNESPHPVLFDDALRATQPRHRYRP